MRMEISLSEAPFSRSLKVISLDGLPKDAQIVLEQLGLFPQELIEKIHSAPLGDPIAIRIGEQVFSLRNEICKLISVEDAS